MFPAPPPSAPPPPAPPVRRGTPLAHCAAGASVWYVALIAAYVIASLRTGSGLGQLGAALLVGASLFVPTTFLTFVMLLRVKVKPWLLILVTLPVYLVAWVLVSGFMGALGAVFRMMIAG